MLPGSPVFDFDPARSASGSRSAWARTKPPQLSDRNDNDDRYHVAAALSRPSWPNVGRRVSALDPGCAGLSECARFRYPLLWTTARQQALLHASPTTDADDSRWSTGSKHSQLEGTRRCCTLPPRFWNEPTGGDHSHVVGSQSGWSETAEDELVAAHAVEAGPDPAAEVGE